MITVSLVQRCRCLFLYLLDFINMFLFFFEQNIVILLLIFLRIWVFICLFIRMLLIYLFHSLKVLLLLLSNLLLQVLNLLAKSVDFLNVIVVLCFMSLGVNCDLLAQFNHVSLETSPLVFRRFDVNLVVFNFRLDIGKGLQLMVESNQRCLHALNLCISISDRKLQVLDFLMKGVDLHGGAWRSIRLRLWRRAWRSSLSLRWWYHQLNLRIRN